MRIALLLGIAGLFALFLVSGAPDWLTLAQLKANLAALLAWRAQHPVLAAACYVALYIALSALAVPGVAVLSVAGGAVFGLWQGVVLTSFGASLGATAAMLASRTLFRDLVQRRFPSRLAQVDQGLAQEGWVYLASLRLAPVVPFALVNLLFGVTAFPVALFYVVSQTMMLPATLVYVNAGTQIDQLTSLSGILSPSVLGALLLLALLGPASRLALRAVRRDA